MNKKLPVTLFFFFLFLCTFFVGVTKNVQADNTFIFNNTLKLNTINEDVKHLQIYLNTHGFILATEGNGSPGNESDYFGLRTENALKLFQKANGLISDGVVGPATRNFINQTLSTQTDTGLTPTLTRVLKLDMIDSEVKALQIYLNTHGFILATEGNGSPGNESDYFGLRTENALKLFQKANGLTPDGVVGPATRNFINQNNRGISTPLHFGDGCSSTLGYSTTTGLSCSPYLSGCNSMTGFSTTTGLSCAPLPGCTSALGFSITTGLSCSPNNNFRIIGGGSVRNNNNDENEETQTTPTFSPNSGEIAFGVTPITITSAGADTIYYTTDGSTPDTGDSTVASGGTITLASADFPIKAYAVRAGYADSAVGTSGTYTQMAATAPTNIVLAVGDTNPVGGVTNVAIPAAGGTDTTGAVTGWVTGTADEIKFTVTDGGDAVSTITIEGGAYTSGDEYTILAATPLTIVVTTTETGKVTGVRTFTVSVAPDVLEVGDSYQGGIIAYILQSGDPGYDAEIQHGLIATVDNQSTGTIQWGCVGTTILGANGTAIGTGNQNTIDIMAGCAEAGIAARISGDLDEGGYTDWYLPSKDELNKLYLNKEAIGNFGNWIFWNSSEYIVGGNGAGAQFFETGVQVDNMGKDNYLGVRSIRSF